jgi:hypothetical protein
MKPEPKRVNRFSGANSKKEGLKQKRQKSQWIELTEFNEALKIHESKNRGMQNDLPL